MTSGYMTYTYLYSEPLLNISCNAHFDMPTQNSSSLDCIKPFPHWPDCKNVAAVIEYTTVVYCHAIHWFNKISTTMHFIIQEQIKTQ